MVILDAINNKFLEKFRKNGSVKISRFFNKNLIVFLQATNRSESLKLLVDSLDDEGKLPCKSSFYRAILEREKNTSADIGMGIAITHAKIKGIKDFFIAVGISKNEIQWKANDKDSIRLIFMIGGPDNEVLRYLHILSRLTNILKDENIIKSILSCSTSEEIFQIFKNY